VEGLGPGNVKRIIKGGYDTIPDIIGMSKEDFLEIDGFKEKLSEKLYTGIKSKLEVAELPEIMKATNIFARGFGLKRLKTILEEYPEILVSKESDEEKIKKVSDIRGIARKTAEAFVENIDDFIWWMEEAKMSDRLVYSVSKIDSVKKHHELFGKKYVLTGFRNKKFIEYMTSVGAIQASSVSKNTDMVIVKDVEQDTGKVMQAKKLGIPIKTIEDFPEFEG